MHGLDHAHAIPPELKSLVYFTDTSANYEQYRHRIDERPALHFLFPLVRLAAKGDKQALEKIFLFRHYQMGSVSSLSTTIRRLFQTLIFSPVY